MKLLTPNTVNFAFIDRNIDTDTLLNAWYKLSERYEPFGSSDVGVSRRAMLGTLRAGEDIEPGSTRLLTKQVTLPNGLPGTVYTGAVDAPINHKGKRMTVYTLAGNPLASKNPMYKGAINSLGDNIEQLPDDYTVNINAVRKTVPLYRKDLGYMDAPTPVGHIKAYRNSLRERGYL